MPSAAPGWGNKKTFEEEGISYRYDIMGKIWKSSIMPVTYITPNNSQKPRDVTYRLQRVRPPGISTFVHPAPAWGGGGQRIPLPAPAPSFANAGFIISHPNRGLGHIHPVTGGDNQSWAGLPMPPDVAEAYRLGLHQHPVPRGSKQCGPGEDTQPLGGSHAGSCSETPRWGRRFRPLLFVFLTGLTFKSLSWNIKFRLG